MVVSYPSYAPPCILKRTFWTIAKDVDSLDEEDRFR
jgi:hypothetical protein